MIAALLAAATVAASPPTVLGLQLGAPLSLPECPLLRAPDIYEPPDMATAECWAAMPNAQHETLIVLPEAKLLTYDYLEQVHGVRVIDGNIECIDLSTRGHTAQDAAMAILIEKFGQPTKQSSTAVQNGFGAIFLARSAQWNRDGYVVKFDGVDSSLDQGRITIRTAKCMDYEIQHAQRPGRL